MKEQIIFRTVLFLATMITVAMWIPVISMLDVSSNSSGSPSSSAWWFPLLLASIFLFIDLLVNWNLESLRRRLAIRSAVVSILGSLFFLTLLFFIGILLGYINRRTLGADAFGILFLGVTFTIIHFMASYGMRKIAADVFEERNP